MTQKKRIIIQGKPFTSSPSGYKNFSLNFLTNLTGRLPDYIFEVVVPENPESKILELLPKVQFTIIPPIQTSPSYIADLLWENTQLYDYMEKQDPHSIAFYLSPYNCLPLPKLKVPELIVIHDIHLWIDTQTQWPLERRFGYEIKKKSIQNADKIFTVSNFSRKEIESYFDLPDNSVTVIGESIDSMYATGMTTNNEKEILDLHNLATDDYFLYIGSFEPRKNLLGLLKAYKQYLKKTTKKKKLVIIGSHTQRSNQHDVFAAYKNTPEVIFIETIDSNSIKTLYKNASAFVYPSTYEGFGLQIIESQTMGTPLLISDIEVFHEIAGDGANYFNPNDPTDISKKMIELESNPELQRSLVRLGKENTHRYDWNKTIDVFLNSCTDYL